MSAHTKLAGVTGWPLTQSLSPGIHGAWLREHGIDGAYVPLPIRREDFSRALLGLRLSGFAGVNVTVPHKEAAFALAHVLDDDARACGAVNLLLFRDRTIEGRNTDAAGLHASLTAELGADVVRDKYAVLLGAGGAARAAVLALARLGASDIHILNRHKSRAETMAAQLSPHLRVGLTAADFSDWPRVARDAALVVNATSAGMAGNPPLDLSLDSLPAQAAICDIVYKPLETDLVKRARARGLRAINGLGMLMHQAVPSFAAFFGVTPTVTPELRAALEAKVAG